MFMLFLLRHTSKCCYHDVTMHAIYFFVEGIIKTHRREYPICDIKERKEKGKCIIGPRMNTWLMATKHYKKPKSQVGPTQGNFILQP